MADGLRDILVEAEDNQDQAEGILDRVAGSREGSLGQDADIRARVLVRVRVSEQARPQDRQCHFQALDEHH
jgi:hypothetical protein